MTIDPKLIAEIDQHAANVAQILDELVEHQRPFVTDQGAENSPYVAALAMMLGQTVSPGHLADLLAVAVRRLAAK